METDMIRQKIAAFVDFFEIGGVQRWMGEAVLGVFYSLESSYLSSDSTFLLVVGYVSTFLLLSYLQAVNDYFDLEIDKARLQYTKNYGDLSKKGPIVGNRISKAEASLSIVLTLAAGLILSIFSSIHFLIVSLLIILMATLYSAPPVRYKEMYLFSTFGEIIGNFLPFLAGYAIIGAVDWKVVLVAAIPAMAATNNRFRHEIKMANFDKSTGKKTIAVVHGLGSARFLARACIVLNLIEVFALSVLGWFSLRFFLLLLVYIFFAYAFWYQYLKGLARKILGLSWGFLFSLFILIYI